MRATGTPRPDDIAVTVYDAVRGDARAWSGRPTSDIPPDRIVGPQDLFVTHSVLGLRLVQIVPILGMEGGKEGRRVGTVAVEHVLSRATAGAAIAPVEDSLQTSIAPVSFRTRFEGAGDNPPPGAFLLRTPGGEPLVEAVVAPADLQRTRAEWRRTVTGWVIVILGLTAAPPDRPAARCSQPSAATAPGRRPDTCRERSPRRAVPRPSGSG